MNSLELSGTKALKPYKVNDFGNFYSLVPGCKLRRDVEPRAISRERRLRPGRRSAKRKCVLRDPGERQRRSRAQAKRARPLSGHAERRALSHSSAGRGEVAVRGERSGDPEYFRQRGAVSGGLGDAGW